MSDLYSTTMSLPPTVPVRPFTPNVRAYPGGNFVPSAGFCSSGQDADEAFFRFSSICERSGGRRGRGGSTPSQHHDFCRLSILATTHLGSKDLKLARVGVDIVIKVDSLDASFVGREVKIEIDAARADSHGRLRLVHTTFKG